MNEVKKENLAPEDKYNFVYSIFYWLGIGTLLPWNFFITVSGYWDYKYRTIINDEEEESSGGGAKNPLQVQWTSYLAVASMVPNVTFLLLNAVFGHHFKTQLRLIISSTMVIILFIFTCIMTKVETDSWQFTFLYMTLFSVVLINISAAIFQGGLLGISGKFPPRYIGAVFSGQALGGIFASSMNILFLALGANPVDAAFFCFLIAVLFLGTALMAYIFVTRMEFFKYYLGEIEKKKVKTVTEPIPEDAKLVEDTVVIKPKVNPLKVMETIWVYALSIFTVFAVTLGCFPAITVLIISTGSGNPWSDKYFIPVVCFLGFNVGDYLGRILAERIQLPRPSRRGQILVFLLSLLRLFFVPLFLFCYANPEKRSVTPVLFESDTVYIILMALFSLSNGYLGAICMMSGPKLCEKSEEQSTAASLMVAFLGLGLGAGALISNGFVLLL